MPMLCKLSWHCARAAASRTFCTAGSKSPISTAMMAMTTKSSMSVKALRPARDRVGAGMASHLWREMRTMAPPVPGLLATLCVRRKVVKSGRSEVAGRDRLPVGDVGEPAERDKVDRDPHGVDAAVAEDELADTRMQTAE